MRKNSLVLGFILMTVILIYIFNSQWQSRIKETNSKALVDAKVSNAEHKKEWNEKLDSLKQGSGETIIDYLKYVSFKNDKANVAILGSSVTRGDGADNQSGNPFYKSWGGLLENYLNRDIEGISNLIVSNYGFSGYSTSGILKENHVDEVIKGNPDVVLFETCLLNNHGQSVSLEQTNNEIDSIVGMIKEKLPDSKIVLQSANPSSKKIGQKNKLGLTYQDYLTNTKAHIEAKGWQYIDVYSEYENLMNKENIKLEDTLSDGIHPNNTGYKLWFEVLKADLSKKL